MDETVVHQPPDEKRLNPFAFPAETNVRFTLLIFALVMFAIDFVEVLAGSVTGGELAVFDLANTIPKLSTSTDPATYVAESIASLWQALGATLGLIALLGGVIGVVLGVAYVLYRTHPARLRRARSLHVFPADKDVKFTGEVRALAGLAGVSPAPVIEMGDQTLSADGQVFGFKGRYSVRLGSRMPLVMRKLPALFRGTVLHEMAHIVNGDVGRAYFSQSLWTTVLVLLLTPTVLIYLILFAQRVGREISALLAGSGGDMVKLLTVVTPNLLLTLAQMACLAALLAAIRGSLLRTREIYADWRAALWGADEGLKAIFRENHSQRKSPGWSRLWRLHPEPQTRLRLLENPRALFAIPQDLPLLVGALVGAAASGFLIVTILFTSLVTTSQSLLAAVLSQGGPFLQMLAFIIDAFWYVIALIAVTGPMFMLTYLTAGTLGLQAQRDGVAAVAMQERRGLSAYFRLAAPAALYALGMQIGFALAPVNFFAPLSRLLDFRGDALSLLSIPLSAGAWLVCVTFLIWLWLAWGRYTARRWMARHSGAQPPDRRRRFLTFYLALILWLLLIPMLVAQAMYWDVLTGIGAILPPSFSILVIGAGLALAAVAAAGGWLLVEMMSAGPITCPACARSARSARKTQQRAAVGQRCEHCGAELAAWIIAQPQRV